MVSGRRSGWDPLAAVAAAIGLAVLIVYMGLIRQQGGQPAVWFVAGIALAVVLAGYGAARRAPRRVPALAVSGVMLALLGLVGILSIGLPVLVAGVLALVAAARSRAAVG